jgi:ABC-type Mn2+/Zn2+ transport system permease subunit
MRADLPLATIWGALGDPLSDPIVGRALLELLLIGVSTGALGCWVVLYGFSYGAESLSHSLLPGLVLATLAGSSIVLGGLAGALVAALAIAAARQVPTVGGDTAIAVVVTTLFGAGVLLALSPASPPGLSSLLFGDVLGTSDGDLALAAISALVVIVVLYTLHGRLLATGFDREAARAIGVRPVAIETSVLVLTALVVVVAVQGLGNLLVLAVLIGPAMVARRLTRRIGTMLFASVGVAALGSAAGIYASYYLGSAAGASVAASFVVLYLLAGVATSLAIRR